MPKHQARGAVEDTIFVEVPVQLKDLVAAFVGLVGAVENKLRLAHGGQAVDYANVEREIQDKTAALECASHKCVLEGLEVDAPVKIRGECYARVGYGNGT